MNKRDRRQEGPDHRPIYVGCSLMRGGVLAGVVAVGALFLCAWLVSVGVLRERWMTGAVLAVCLLGALAGGRYAVKQIRSRTLLVGLGVGAMLFLMLLLAGALAYGVVPLAPGAVWSLAACLIGGGLSGLFGVGTQKKRRR